MGPPEPPHRRGGLGVTGERGDRREHQRRRDVEVDETGPLAESSGDGPSLAPDGPALPETGPGPDLLTGNEVGTRLRLPLDIVVLGLPCPTLLGDLSTQGPPSVCVWCTCEYVDVWTPTTHGTPVLRTRPVTPPWSHLYLLTPFTLWYTEEKRRY